MIPKIIHYCWFGGAPLPPLARRCIESWRHFLPEYEIRRWDESNFNVREILYTSQAYAAGKYAFVSDYARFKILYEHGGLYFDTDVELLRRIDDIIAAGPFMGCETDGGNDRYPKINPGLGIGAPPGHPFYASVIRHYSDLAFLNPDGSRKKETVVNIISAFLKADGLDMSNDIQTVDGIRIYPKEYFCPTSFMDHRPVATGQTRAIHHYAGTWLDDIDRKAIKIGKYLGYLPEPSRTNIAYRLASLYLKLFR